MQGKDLKAPVAMAVMRLLSSRSSVSPSSHGDRETQRERERERERETDRQTERQRDRERDTVGCHPSITLVIELRERERERGSTDDGPTTTVVMS